MVGCRCSPASCRRSLQRRVAASLELRGLGQTRPQFGSDPTGQNALRWRMRHRPPRSPAPASGQPRRESEHDLPVPIESAAALPVRPRLPLVADVRRCTDRRSSEKEPWPRSSGIRPRARRQGEVGSRVQKLLASRCLPRLPRASCACTYSSPCDRSTREREGVSGGSQMDGDECYTMRDYIESARPFGGSRH